MSRGRRVQVTALLDSLPEAGPIRDAVFASAGALVAFTTSAFLVWAMQRNERKMKAAAEERGPASIPQLGPADSPLVSALGLGSSQKESVEWVNMVLHKIWKVYRRSLEAWLVGLLQPAIDTLPLPSIVRRVEIAEFSLDYEPLSVRNVQRRASRRANDLQYHVGLRYTGDARCLLLLHMTVAGFDFRVPVGVHNLDVDAELWVKLRLTPRKPYVGTLSIAFVRLPTIKLVLAPFRIVNVFAIPFLSSFLSKLLTIDLPRLLVLPRHITFDFLPAGEEPSHSQHQPGTSTAPSTSAASANLVLDLLKSETFTGLAHQEPLLSSAPARMEPSDAFVGELSVTLCEARNLPTLGLAVWSNPYCRLRVGEAVAESKRNSETSHPAGARDPVWNQDFLFWVEDPSKQKLTVVVRDSMAPLNRNIGFVEVPIWQLQDCAPLSMWLPLLQDGPFGVKPAQGEVRLLLTYKSYVDQRDRDEAGGSPAGAAAASPSDDVVAYIKVFGTDESEGSESEASLLASVEEEEPDSDSERERQLQLERQAKGLDKLGEEPGVEVVASNVAQVQGAPKLESLGAPDPLPHLVGSSSEAGSPSKRGLIGGVWDATKSVAVGAGAVAGALAGATGGILAAAGGAVAAGAGHVMSGAGSVAAGVGDRVKGLVAKKGPEYVYVSEEDEYSSEEEPLDVRVKSYLAPAFGHEGGGSSADSDEEAVPAGKSQARGASGELSDGDDFLPMRAVGEIEEMVYGPYSQATVEQRVARLVEWNLEATDNNVMQSLTSAPRLSTLQEEAELASERGGEMDSPELENGVGLGLHDESSMVQKSVHETATTADEMEGHYSVGDQAVGDSHDRWRSVQGAISDLMDFFSR